MPLPNVKVEYENKIDNTEDCTFSPSFHCKAEAYKRCVKFNWYLNTTTVKLSHKDAIEHAIFYNLEYSKYKKKLKKMNNIIFSL